MSELEGATEFFAQRASMPPMPTIERPRLAEPMVRRWLTLLGFELVTAVSLLASVADFRRLQTLRDYVAGTATFADIEHGDDIGLRFLQARVALTVFSGLMLALWTYRTVKNAAVRYPSNAAGPVSAALFWFVPIFSFFVPWSRLRWAARTGGAPEVGTLSVWQVVFVLGTLSQSLAFRLAPDVDISSVHEIVSDFQRTVIIGAIASVSLVISVIAALVAMPQIDRQTSGTVQ